MPLTNLPVFAQMLTDSRLRRFLRENKTEKGPVTGMPLGRQLRLYAGFLRGERIIRFNGMYNIISLIPPLPSRAFARFLAVSRGNIFSAGSNDRKRVPVSVTLCMTDRCNYSCVHCGINLGNGSELSTGEWIRVIGELQDMGTAYISLSGGEPLLREDAEEIITSTDDRSILYLFTNGKALTAARARSLKNSGLFAVTVSLDSVDPAIHNFMRADEHAFEHALSAISRSRSAGLYTLAQAVVFRKDLDRASLFKLFRLAKRQGVHEFRILKPARAGSLLDVTGLVEDEIFYTPEDDEFVKKLQIDANRRWGMPKVTCFPFSEIGKFDCNAGIRHAYISARGDLMPCDFIPLAFGNVRSTPVAELFSRMTEAVGCPKSNCWSADLAPYLAGSTLPVPPRISFRLAEEARDQERPKTR